MMLKISDYQKVDIPVETPDDSFPVFIPTIAVMISYTDLNGRNSITPIVSWAVVSRYPFTVEIGLCNGCYTENYFPRHSRKVIRETREFVLNIPHSGLRDAVSIVGDVSSSDPDVDKFALSGLTPGPSKTIKSPIILECPINLECKVTQIVEAGSHDIFFATVSAIQCDPVLRRTIADDIMMMDVLRPSLITGEMEESRLVWKTLPEFTVPTK